ncbi:hypothetical protein ACFOOM_07595 [Streptomyces echinoruber]|uniref:Uncharacterized protein n=1 Tax=Streptomyces echinoruber TaxID=68898 RepID=A0A918R155_9ACTN|nr:hypothetical protein [Streptomyces echinoruber]GGZ80269.1 hypothetical protein GCM10010389_17570 [Streptomyces echinoruber]
MITPDQQIAALKRERAGYVARGLKDRVAQVDKEIARLRGEGTSEDEAPQGRSGPQAAQQTAGAAPGDGKADGTADGARKTAAKKTAAPPQK